MALDYLPSPGWAVIYGETPSATRWSELGDNDDALATGAGIDDLAILTRHIKDAAVTSRKAQLTILNKQGTDLNPLTGSYQDIPNSSLTFTLDTASYILLTFGCRQQQNTALTSYLQLIVDGSSIKDLRNTNPSGATYVEAHAAVVLTLAAGSHTIKLQAYATANNAAVAIAGYWRGIVVSQ